MHVTIVSAGGDQVIIGITDVYNEMRTLSANMSTLMGKFDTTAAINRVEIGNMQDGLVAAEKRDADYELRLRVIEQRPVITPRAMWAGIGVLIAAFGVLMTIMSVIIDVVGK
jgi:hypothetical protein